jgi:hypothetical protein
MLPGGPLFPFNPAIRFFPGVEIHFSVLVLLWQSNDKNSLVTAGG